MYVVGCSLLTLAVALWLLMWDVCNQRKMQDELQKTLELLFIFIVDSF